MICRVLCIAATLCVSLSGQTVTLGQTVSEQDSISHLKVHSDPIYPPIAKAAHISGDVHLAVTIEADGKVSGVKTISGPAMLMGAAIDAVKSWTYAPFEVAGTAERVTTEVTVPFVLPKPKTELTKAQLQAEQATFPLEDKCRTALRAADHEAAVTACSQALDMALIAGDITNSDQLSLLDAHEMYGHALLVVGQLSKALSEENAAIEEAKKCLTDTDQEYGTPFYWRAMIEAASGQADAAFVDIKIAEDSQRRAIQHLPSMKEIYGRYLASMLRQHAAWLDQMGKSAEANTLRTEAASL